MFTIGADIEVPLHNGKHFVSCIGRIGGTKDNPLLTEFGNFQEDNVLAEYAINIANNKDEFVTLVYAGFEELKEFIKPLTPVIESFIEFPEIELMHPKAVEFGCAADACAWTDQINRAPNVRAIGNFRTAGGHIHIGHEEVSHPLFCKHFVKYLDLYLGVPSLLLENVELTVNRRKFYGAAGAYRRKDYGVEYRSLSNFWIKDKATIAFMYDQVVKAIDAFNLNKLYNGPDVSNILNSGLINEAQLIIDRYEICSI